MRGLSRAPNWSLPTGGCKTNGALVSQKVTFLDLPFLGTNQRGYPERARSVGMNGRELGTVSESASLRRTQPSEPHVAE